MKTKAVEIGFVIDDGTWFTEKVFIPEDTPFDEIEAVATLEAELIFPNFNEVGELVHTFVVYIENEEVE